MLTIVTWLWKTTGWRTGYGAEHVNTLQRMVAANLSIPHVFKCFTDMPEGIDCETYPLWASPPTDTHKTKPNCYRRLKAFGTELRPFLGEKFVSLDLDCVICGDITPILDKKDDFLILEGSSSPYNGSMWMMKTGSRKKVWDDFSPQSSPIIAAQQKTPQGRPYYGSDQAWISYKIPGEKTWSKKDGIYQYVYDIKDKPFPNDARIIFYAGAEKPWSNSNFVKLHNMYGDYAIST